MDYCFFFAHAIFAGIDDKVKEKDAVVYDGSAEEDESHHGWFAHGFVEDEQSPESACYCKGDGCHYGEGVKE